MVSLGVCVCGYVCNCMANHLRLNERAFGLNTSANVWTLMSLIQKRDATARRTSSRSRPIDRGVNALLGGTVWHGVPPRIRG